MKMKHAMLAATCGFALTTFTYGQEPAIGTVIDITGSTAFRSGANATILSIMSGETTAYLSGAGIVGTSNSSRTIYKGTVNGNQYTVRCSWSGSAAGVQTLADQTNVQFMAHTTVTSGAGTATASPTYVTNPPTFAFSDVAQDAAGRPNAVFDGGPVAVVPFVFVAGVGAPAGITNMTDQQHNFIWSNGGATASLLTGNSADNGHQLYPTGRSNTSGTRITILSETRYGRGTIVTQFNSTSSGDNLTGSPTVTGSGGNAGLAGNADVAALLGKTPVDSTYSFISYLGVPDSVIAVADGARALTYNGVAYSAENVTNGKYTLWGFQQLYRKTGLSTLEVEFDTALRGAVDANLGTEFVSANTLTVGRLGGDGGAIIQN